jgi:prolyl 4-hydroxylase
VQLAQAGQRAEQIAAAMVSASWSERAASDAISTVLSDYVRRQNPLGPAAVPLPAPDLSDSPRWIDVDDRRVDVLMAVEKPRIVLFGGFLDAEECAALIGEAGTRLARSTVVSNREGGEIHPSRSSEGMFFRRGETELLQRIEERIARLLHWPVENGEGFQILRYAVGAEYKPHYDYFGPERPNSERHLRRGGNRVATMMIYLNDVAKGGCTRFPDVGSLTVPVVRGNALLFTYPLAHPCSQSQHGADPVIEGEKWVAVKWLREHTFT